MLENIDTTTLKYSNVSFINSSTIALPATTTETRSGGAILAHPNEWVMSVVRFDIDSHTLPINVPLMEAGSNSITQSVVTLEYKGVLYSQSVLYTNPVTNRIYNFPTIYNYEEWLNMVNVALGLAFIATGAVGAPPIFIYNSVTNLIELYVDQNFIPTLTYAGAPPPTQPVVTPPAILMFMNNQLFNYFFNFPSLASTVNPLLAHQISIDATSAYVMPPIGSRQGLPLAVQGNSASTYYVNLYRVTDTSPSTGSWSSVRSILLTSSLLPFRSETIPNNNNQTSSFSANNTFPILSDFLVPIESKVTDFRVVNEYLPSAQYRYIDLYSSSPMSSIDLTFYWSDFTGNIYPLFLLPQSSFSVKLLFQKRNSLIDKNKI